MTLDIVMWPLTSSTYEGTPIASLTQVWLQSDFKLFKGDPNNVNLTKLEYTYIHTQNLTKLEHTYTQKEFAIAVSPFCFSSHWDKKRVITHCLFPVKYMFRDVLNLFVNSFRVPSPSGKSGKIFYIFPVREKSGNLIKMPKIRDKSGNFDFPKTQK